MKNGERWPAGVPHWYLEMRAETPQEDRPLSGEDLGPNGFLLGPAFGWFAGELCDDVTASGWEFYGHGAETTDQYSGIVAGPQATLTDLLRIAADELHETEKDLQLVVTEEDEVQISGDPSGQWWQLPTLRILVANHSHEGGPIPARPQPVR